MFKSSCPSCSHVFWKPEIKLEKEISKYKWYQFSRNKVFCPNCHIKLGKTKRTKIIFSLWYIVFIPFWFVIVVGGWPESTLNSIKYTSYLLTIVYLALSLKYHEYQIESE